MEMRSMWVFRLVLILLTLIVVFFIVQLLPLFISAFSFVRALILPVGLAVLLTYLLHPVTKQLESYGLSRTLAVLLIFLVIICSIGYFFIVGLPALSKQAELALAHIPSQLKELESMSNRFQAQVNTLPPPIRTHMEEWIEQLEKISGQLVDQIENIAVFLFRSAFSFMVIPFLVFYFLKDYELIQRTLWYVTPKRWRKPLQHYIQDVDSTLGQFIRGQLLVSLVIGVMSIIGLWIIGVPYPIVLGIFIGVANLIPYFGAFIGAAPAVVIALFESWQLALFTVILIFILQQIEGNILAPFIVGKSLSLHPMVIILALIVGVEAGGVIGLLLAVPLLAVGKVSLIHIRRHLMSD